ncbi:MAG: hypothetical protein ABII12_09820 [Planctomycetota bacterium]
MTVYLDDSALDSTDESATLAQTIDIAKAKLVGSDGMIVGVRCDGEDIPPDRLDEVLPQPLSRYGRVDLLSACPREVVVAALRDVRTALEETFVGVKSSAEALAGGHVSKAMQSLSECLSVWGRAHASVMESCSLLGLRLDDMQIDGRPIVDWLVDLSDKLRGIKGAIEARDHVLLGDMLRYEMEETLDAWDRTIEGLIRHIESL